jgi:cold shock CspA family protein
VNSEVRGQVVAFDEASGLGTMRSEEGETFMFHCVDIADGSRTIEVGARVRANRIVGRLGRDEVVGLQPLP